MSGFLYYLPGERATNFVATGKWVEARDRHGLKDVLFDVRDPANIESRDVSSGPDGKPGAIVCCRRNDGKDPGGVGYFAGKQTWAPTFGSAWIGYAELPRPEWLMRIGDSRSGLPTHDSFDRRWLIPVARRPRTNGQEIGESLPMQTRFGADRSVTRTVRADARKLWDVSGRVWNTFNEEADDPLTDDELQVVALDAWAWNYRIGPAEANAYADAGEPVIDNETVQRFALSLIHWEILKGSSPRGKDEPPAGSNSSTGSKEETPAGDLAGVN